MASNTRRAIVALAAAVVSTAVSTYAQQTPQPVFRSGTSIVEITVIVRDRDGRFVSGLAPDDFAILEGGQRRKIELMYLVRGPERSSRASALEKAPPPEGRQAGRVFVFAFDLAQMTPRSFTRARDAAVKFAKERLLPSDSSGVVVLAASSKGRVSNEHAALIESLGQLKASAELVSRDRPLREWPRILSFQEASEIANGNLKALEEARDRACREREGMSCVNPALLPGAGGGPPESAQTNRSAFQAEANRETIEAELRAKSTAYVSESRSVALRSIASLQSLAESIEPIRGRKTIVWFTEGTPVLEVANQAREAAVRAAQSGVAVYVIDPRGLQSRTADVQETGMEEMGLDVLKDTGDLPTLMASSTGGLFIRNENLLDRALGRIEDDTSSYYVIAYATDDTTGRSDRRVTVRLAREGLTARVRTGFMAPQRATRTAGSAVASPLTVLPGDRWALSMPVGASTRSTATVPTTTVPTKPTATAPTKPTGTHVPTTTTNVLRLRGLSAPGGSASDFASRGWSAYQRGDLEAALPLLEQAAARPDVKPWTLYALGFTYVGVGRPRDAIAAWERVRKAAPAFTPVYHDLAAHYAQMSDVTRALQILRDAARRWPGNHDIHNGIGVLMVRREALNDAIEAFTRATQAAPDDPLGWLNLGRAYELRYDRALRYDEHLLRWVGPAGDRAKAQQAYERCVKLGGPYAQQAADALARMNWSQ